MTIEIEQEVHNAFGCNNNNYCVLVFFRNKLIM